MYLFAYFNNFLELFGNYSRDYLMFCYLELVNGLRLVEKMCSKSTDAEMLEPGDDTQVLGDSLPYRFHHLRVAR